MELYADTANLKELEELAQLGIISGVTTNPIILSQEGANALETLEKIGKIFPNKPIFAQITGRTFAESLEQGRQIAAISGNMVVKVPTISRMYPVIRKLKCENIKICATTILTPVQAYHAIALGVDYLAPYVKDIDKIGYDGMKVLQEILTMLQASNRCTKLLAAALNEPHDLVKLAMLGADALTLSYSDIKCSVSSFDHITGKYLDDFEEAWSKSGCTFQ